LVLELFPDLDLDPFLDLGVEVGQGMGEKVEIVLPALAFTDFPFFDLSFPDLVVLLEGSEEQSVGFFVGVLVVALKVGL
jgi:hypothetical protein